MFHTILLASRVTLHDFSQLHKHFKSYSNSHKNIRLFKEKQGKKKGKKEKSAYTMQYLYEKGISWSLVKSSSEKYCYYYVEAKINPKVFTGIADYVEVATSDCIDELIHQFNKEAFKISPLLKSIFSYYVSRIDYCVNIDVDKLEIPLTTDKIFKLIKRADIPYWFVQRTEYDRIAKRRKSSDDSFYLITENVVINCYKKFNQLNNEFPSCPDIDKARNIIRFEVQLYRRKIRTLLEERDSEEESYSELFELTDDVLARRILMSYYNKTIMLGDYYTLDRARTMIENNQKLEELTKEKLTETLSRINKYKSIYLAKESLSNEERAQFIKNLHRLVDLGINPVTIPEKWGVSHIKNLLGCVTESLITD